MSNEIRLNKYLSEAGICSRREADRLIEAGKVTVDGTIADLGTRVGDSSVVTCNGKPVHLHTKKVIYAYNKPIGQVCTSKDADPDSIFRYVEFPERVNYVGRLDKDSTGLLLLTNDGDLANEIQRSRNNHEKEYHVRVNTDITEDFIKKMSEGVEILDIPTLLHCAHHPHRYTDAPPPSSYAPAIPSVRFPYEWLFLLYIVYAAP